MPSAWSLGGTFALAATVAAAAAVADPAVASTSRIARRPIDWKLKERASVTDAGKLAGQTFDYVIVG